MKDNSSKGNEGKGGKKPEEMVWTRPAVTDLFNNVPKLIVQKRHIEKKLSIAQKISCFSRKQKGRLPLDKN